MEIRKILWRPIHKLALCIIKHSLPGYLEISKESKKYADEISKKPNGFHELDFYNGATWLKDKIENY
jgi:hypothetical protein